jgi:hypothetical protein
MVANMGSLRVPAILGIDAQKQQSIHGEWDTMTGVNQRMHDNGFEVQEQPNFSCPMVTEEDLTTTDNTRYSKNYARLLAWFNFADQLLAETNATLLGIENEMEFVAANLRKKMREQNQGKSSKDPSRFTAEQMNDEILLDEHHHELQIEQQRLTQMKLKISTNVNGLERGLRVTSRQVEIRKLELEAGRKGDGLPTRGRFEPRRP